MKSFNYTMTSKSNIANKNNKSDLLTKWNNVKVHNINFEPFVEPTTISKGQSSIISKGQSIAYPRYTNDNNEVITLLIQAPNKIKISTYGIPNKLFTEKDSDRAKIKLPLDQSIPEVKEFSEFLQQIDTKLSSENFRKKMWPQASPLQLQQLEYQSCYHIPTIVNENDDKKKKYIRHPYMNIKLDMSYPDNQIKTIVFNEQNNIRTKLDDIKTIDDFANVVKLNSYVTVIFRLSKLWCQPFNKKNPMYGLGFKVVKIAVEPPQEMYSNIKEFLESDTFLDSDKESDTIETVVLNTKSSSVVKNKQIAQVESDDESDEESDEEPIKEPIKAANKTTKVINSDEESDEEPDEEPIKANNKTTKVIESDEESDEEVKPAKKSTSKPSPAKAPTKVKKNNA